MSVVTTSIYLCSKCGLEYLPLEIINGTIKSVTMSANLAWVVNIGTPQENDKSKDQKKTNLCSVCTDSLLAWFQDNGIED